MEDNHRHPTETATYCIVLTVNQHWNVRFRQVTFLLKRLPGRQFQLY
jgi:hypothetical protein